MILEKTQATLAAAWQLWQAAKPITGTKAIKYLADVRAIDVDLLPTDDNALRYHPRCPFGPGNSAPCLIAHYRDVETDAFAGIHRIALTDDVLFAGGAVQRRTLGHWPAPRAIKVWPATDQLFLGEGIETVLAAATRLSHHDKPMRPAWAAGNAGNLRKFPVLPSVKHLTLLVDHDAEGQQSADACQLRYRAAKRDIVQLQPDRVGTDFNDLVLEQYLGGAMKKNNSKAGFSERMTNTEGVSIDDFYAYMLQSNNYIFTPTRELWPANSVNARLGKVPLFDVQW